MAETNYPSIAPLPFGGEDEPPIAAPLPDELEELRGAVEELREEFETHVVEGAENPAGGVSSWSVGCLASEALAANDMVNLWLSGGVLKARKASAAAGRPCDGYAAAPVAGGGTAVIHFDGIITGLSSLTFPAAYFLSATAGLVTATAPAVSGNIIQVTGQSLSATQLYFERKPFFTIN